MAPRSFSLVVVVTLFLTLCLSCSQQQPPPRPDNPRLTSRVVMQDVSFRSVALQRDVVYRVIIPNEISHARKLTAVYLLHGGGGGYRDWSNYSDVAQYAEAGFVLVMPEGESSYWINSADRKQDRYEDFIVNDLLNDVQHRFPVSSNRNARAIVGVSMGGFGAVTLGLKHPDLFRFVGGISSALDVPTRPFSFKRIAQWRHHRSIFGSWNGQHQQENDPYVLARHADPGSAPFFFLTCGDQEGLLPANRRLASQLQERQVPFLFRTAAAGHNWQEWNQQLPELFRNLHQHLPE